MCAATKLLEQTTRLTTNDHTAIATTAASASSGITISCKHNYNSTKL